MESTLNENEFWLGLYKLVNDECSKYGDSTAPLPEQIIEMMEIVAQKIRPDGQGWYSVRGEEHPDPQPAEPPLNMFILGMMLGNFLAWRSGVKFADKIKEDH